MKPPFRIGAALAAAGAVVVISAFSLQPSALAQAPVATARALPAVTGSRDSYADVVKNVAPIRNGGFMVGVLSFLD